MKNFSKSEFNEVWENLRFFVKSLARIKNSRFLELSEKSFCVDTCFDSASENWVFYSEKLNQNDVFKIVEFFGSREFIFPIYGEPENSELEILEKSGLKHAGNLLAMNFNPEKAKYDFKTDFVIADNDSLLKEWAETSLRGFEVEFETLPEEFLNLALSFRNDDKNIIPVISKTNDVNCGSFLIAKSKIENKEISGIYYFSVIPEYRRHGIAREMMNFASELSNKIVLQATPSGIPFYKNVGFKELFEIKIFSKSDDIF